MFDDIDFTEQVLPRLLVAVVIIPAFILGWWFLKMFDYPLLKKFGNKE